MTGGVKRAPGWVRWALVGGAVVLALVVIGRPGGGDGPPLDPESTGPLGTRALVLLLEDLGAEVDIAADVGDIGAGDIVLVLEDRVQATQDRRALLRSVDEGATLVVADPISPFQPYERAGSVDGDLDRDCAVPALEEVEELEVEGAVAFDVTGSGTACFPTEDGAYLGVGEQGDGIVVGLGGARPFTNDSLGDADNAVLVAALLAPRPGTDVALLQPATVGDGDQGLVDLVSPGVRGGLLQLGVAFVVYALWRARRLGKPVPEPQPVPLAASELVVAVGNLLQQAGRRDQAGALLRADLRRTLADRLGLPVDAPAEVVATTAAARTGIPLERLRAALGPWPVPGDAELVALSAEVSRLGEAVSHG